MAKRPAGEINASSMADIAFLLLILFLVTTTMDVNKGIYRMLPPKLPPDAEAPKIKERNILVVKINANDQLLVNNEIMFLEDLKMTAKDFLANPYDRETLPEKEAFSTKLTKERATYTKLKNSEEAGEDQRKTQKEKVEKYEKINNLLGREFMVSKGVISLQNDRGTSYDMYIKVQDELARAITEIRNDVSKQLFGIAYDNLDDNDRIAAVETLVPASISEAEPKNLGGD